MPHMTPEVVAALRSRRVSSLHRPGFSLPDNSTFEPPCSIKWMQAEHSLALSAFSYAVSGHYFACRIGRYTSIGESVQIGRHSHPTHWSSTSPFFYQPHRNVLDMKLDEASDVELQDFMLGKPGQTAKITEVGNDVWIGHGAFIAPGVRIGHGAVIGAHSVVTKDVPPYAIVVGVPATVKKLRFAEAVVERMLRSAWWRYPFWDLKGCSTTEPERFLDRLDELRDKGLSEYKPELIHLRDLIKASAETIA